jgi:NDP-sugar pyrophosphorylase family protein
MLKLSAKGSRLFKLYYKKAKLEFKKKKFYNAKNFEQAYLTDFFNYLISKKIKIKCVLIKNNWMEIDTTQDYKRAQNFFY